MMIQIIFLYFFTTVIATATSVPCTQVACKCPYGTIWFKDENGCDRCTCKQQDPCATVRCAAGTVCQANPDNTASCVPKCSQVMCAMYCENGFEYDNTGCPICRCLDPCANIACSSDEICKIQNNTCTPFSANCQPYIGVCTPNPCTPVACKCPYGTIWFKDENGCDMCSCKQPDPCATVRCAEGTVCQVNADNTASCVPNCSQAMCLMYCEYGFEYDKFGCPICKCSDPCANVTCGLNQVCNPLKSTCKQYSSTCSEYTGVCLRKCADVSTCTKKCAYGLFYDVWGCPQCKCLDPCAGVLCPPKNRLNKPPTRCVAQKSACPKFSIFCQPYIGVCN